VLADGEFYRVGGHTSVHVSVRIIAATHQNLEQLVRDGRFREDIYHRLNVIRIHLPGLRERREDIPRLARHFLARAAEELGGETKVLLPETETYISTLQWPGNVRQLENVCRWLTVMAAGREVHVADLPPELLASGPVTTTSGDWVAELRAWADAEVRRGTPRLLDTAMPRFETAMIEVALAQTRGRRGEAAELLGWGRNTLTRKIKELELEDLAEDTDSNAA
jgi:two-component system nitrogen regulation response regulator GlnG